MYIGLGRCIDLEYYNIVRHFIFIVCKVRQFWSDHIICLSSVYIRVIKREPKITGRFSLAKNKDRARFESSAKCTRIIYFFVSACTLKNLSKKKSTKKPLTKTGSNLQMSGSGSVFMNFMNITTLSRYCEAVRQKVLFMF